MQRLEVSCEVRQIYIYMSLGAKALIFLILDIQILLAQC